MVICVILTPFPFYKNIIFFFQADIVLIKMMLYLPNFSLMFLIHVFLYAGVYCNCFSLIFRGEYQELQNKELKHGNNKHKCSLAYV